MKIVICNSKGVRERLPQASEAGQDGLAPRTQSDRTIYTFWDSFLSRWERNAGLRIDHIPLSPSIARRLASVGVDLWARGEPKPSDHVPVWVKLAPEGNAKVSKPIAEAKARKRAATRK